MGLAIFCIKWRNWTMIKNNQKIPEGWSVKKLGECFSFSAGGDVDKDCFSETKDDLHPYPIYANALTNEGLYGYSSKYKVKEECITITGRGDIGNVFYRKGYFTPIVRLITAIPNAGIKAKFMSYACSQIHFFDESTGVPQLTVPQVQWYKILLPPLLEQEKIAGILGTWDEAIEKLSGLIEQKKLLKKGLMQRLLTGKTRLSTFTQPWKDIELSDLLNYEQPSKYLVGEILPYDKNKIPVLTANKAFILGSTDDSSGIYTQGDCIIFDDFTTDIKYVNFPFKVKSSAIKILTPKTNTNLKFVYEQMKCIKYPLAGHKRYYLSEYQYITISIPDISEQQAIADVLSTADDEINLLNQKLEALKEQKKGLMQQLLTGQIRVKVN